MNQPNPAAAALYTQAAVDYEAAARDADKLGAHTRADNHRRRAAEHRALATAYSATAWDDDDNKPVIPRIPKPRKPHVTAPTCGTCPRCRGTGQSPDSGMCAACFGSGQLSHNPTHITATDVCPLCEYFRCRCNSTHPGSTRLDLIGASA